MLIGIVVGIVVVVASAYATGLTKLLLSPFGSSAEYGRSESATAPELAMGNWINSEPLKLKDLRGRVVLIEFWTFGCYNCRNTLPYVKKWNDRYRDKGLTVIGVHSPEFEEERKVENLRREISSLGLVIRSSPITTIKHGTLITSKPGQLSFWSISREGFAGGTLVKEVMKIPTG
jgi:thiol-disulfide isomerase/thioredoxin